MTFKIMTALNSQYTYLNIQKKVLSSITITASAIVAFVVISGLLPFTFLVSMSITFKAVIIVVSAGASVLSSIKMNKTRSKQFKEDLILKSQPKLTSQPQSFQPQFAVQLENLNSFNERQLIVNNKIFNDVNIVDEEFVLLEKAQSARRLSLELQRRQSLFHNLVDEAGYQKLLERAQVIKSTDDEDDLVLSEFIREDAERLKQEQAKKFKEERQEQIEEINKQNGLKKEIVNTPVFQSHLEAIRSFGLHKLKKVERQENQTNQKIVYLFRVDLSPFTNPDEEEDSDSEWED